VLSVAKGYKSYGIKSIQGGTISGIDSLLAKLNAMPDRAREGLRQGIERAMGDIRAQAVNNIGAFDGEIINAITAEAEVQGDTVQGRVYVAAQGFDPVQWPVFVEMGTGPHGIASSGGPSGAKYPLPSSAYTQQGWYYMGDDSEFHYSEGRDANPYLWPAYQARKPFIREIIADSIGEEMSD